MNKVILIGRLTKEPEIRITQSGKKVASFSLAVDDGKNPNGGKQAQFFNCTAWEKTAEITEKYVNKGSQVCIIGKLENRSWEKDGVKKYSTDIFVKELEMLSSKKESQPSKIVEQLNKDTELPEISEEEFINFKPLN